MGWFVAGSAFPAVDLARVNEAYLVKSILHALPTRRVSVLIR